MTRPLAVLRPEPGNAATAGRIAMLGLVAIRLPLFAVAPVAWRAPDPTGYDALLLTSANALRHGGDELDRLKALPVHAVGAATARAAADAGFTVRSTGDAGVTDVMASAGAQRLLHLAGRDRIESGADTITVYASTPLPVEPDGLAGSVALLHSARAAIRLGEVVADRPTVAVAAISRAVAEAAGTGWAAVAVAERPTDGALIAAARRLAD
ncbi:uroporphyrinogen-III synthase [Sphingomonas sp.]|uniref:uroporphyrinogen-III synthase n=1 Tax=Sphingomonas sp. TaxID=28214 RepID=UPI002B80A231|nr:uroporphyrinogen-III synthase [Sphingomonas sp.]HWK37192.1 uroporphyrinogen-III synthase [Sphingomonas sp.]